MSSSLREPFDERESWSEERWRAVQWERLRCVVELAATSLPFYRERLAEAGMATGKLRSWDDLARIPLTTKADVIAAMRERRSRRVGMEASDPDGALVLGMTTGTVGTAILEFAEKWRRVTGDAAARAYWWAGLRSGMSMLVAAPGCGSTWPRLRIYDRRVNTVTVGRRELLWYDVRRCVDAIPDLVSSPCAIVRDGRAADTLTVVIERPTCDDIEGIEGRLREIFMDRLQVPLAVEWNRELPSRWKGVAIIERGDIERRDG